MTNRDFKGVWIPKEIWLNDELTMLEKVILIEIDSLDNEEHCRAGNDYLAEFCRCSIPKVTEAVKKLIDLGYIELISFDGRHRVLGSLIKSMMQPNTKYEAESGKVLAINKNNNIPNNNIVINNNEESSSSTSEIETTQPTETKKKRTSRKDQLTEYVESLVIQPETKDIIYKWIFSIGLKGGVTVDKLKDMLNDIWLNSNKDEALVRESINKSYLSNWFGFYPVKQAQTYSEASKPTQKVETPTTPEKSSSTPITPSPELLAQIGREVRAKFDPTVTY